MNLFLKSLTIKILLVIIIELSFTSNIFTLKAQGQKKIIKEIVESIEMGDSSSIIVMDIRNGQIVGIRNDDLAFRRAFAPGSIFKIFLSVFLLQNRIIEKSHTYSCAGNDHFKFGDIKCWINIGHGKMDLVNAIAHSCNLYFLSLYDSINMKDYYFFLKDLGFGMPTGVNRPGETPGRLVLSYNPEFLIGDDKSIQVTPLQLLTILSALFNGGYIFYPYIEDDVKNTVRVKNVLNISCDVIDVIKEGMILAVKYGSARKLDFGDECRILAKTGTSSFEKYEWLTHGWAVAFYPADQPEIGIISFVYKGNGYTDAIYLIKEFFSLYLDFEEE